MENELLITKMNRKFSIKWFMKSVIYTFYLKEAEFKVEVHGT